MKTKNLLSLTLTLFLLGGTTLPAHAGIKCWTNHEGIRECGNRVPPEYAQQGHQELSKQGTVIEEQERAKTTEEIAEEQRQAELEAEKLKQEEERHRQDKILLDTFSNVEDIELARDGKIAAIESTIHLTNKRIEKIQEDLDKRIKAAAAEERSGNTPNEALLKDIESLRRQIKNNEAFIAKKRTEQEEVKSDYDIDIERFKNLKGIPTAPAEEAANN